MAAAVLVSLMPSSFLAARGGGAFSAPPLRSATPRMEASLEELQAQLSLLESSKPAAVPAPVAAAPVALPAVVEPPVATMAPDVSMTAPPSVASDVVLSPSADADADLSSIFSSLSELAESLQEASKDYIDPNFFPVVATFVLVPVSLFFILLLVDSVNALIRLVTDAKTETITANGPVTAEGGGVWDEDASFDDALSAWPAILELKRGLEALPAEDQRRLKLEDGTNWPPRTTTAKPFDDERTGYMFFQAPTPLTSNQEGMPGFFSQANFRDLEVPSKLLIFGGTFGAAFLVVGGLVLLG